MQKRLLLLKLRLCRGISVHGENLVYEWLKANSNVNSSPSVHELVKIARIAPQFQRSFKEHFNSQELLNELRYNIKHVHWVSILDDHYPVLLRESHLPPTILFYLGNWHLTQLRLLAIVGARQNSRYTEQVLNGLLPSIVHKGIGIVSGLARGVDRISHELTLKNSGHTIAIIGTGLDQYYPLENRLLQNQIAQNQLLITEYPLGTTVRKHHFPQRNRIIAGLVENVLVIEAKRKSGSLITANLALDNDRNVLAVPGPINSSLSIGCNDLIAEGARPILCAQDVLDQFFDLTI